MGEIMPEEVGEEVVEEGAEMSVADYAQQAKDAIEAGDTDEALRLLDEIINMEGGMEEEPTFEEAIGEAIPG